MNPKIKSASSLTRTISALHSKGKRVVFTNGCFDILHAGHVKYLRRASMLGDVLVVGLNSDSSVRRIKGPSRPVNNQNDRAEILSSLYFVDYVTIFAEETPRRVIGMLKPDVLTKGGDWKTCDMVGGDFVREHGGRVVSIPFVKGYSTTSLIKKICKK